MKNLIVIAMVLLAGCSSLKTTDQRGGQWNGDAAVAYLKANALARQRADAELNRMLKDFPARTFDLQVGIVESRSAGPGLVQLVIPVKMNFKREWLINFWQHIYALNEENGGMAQITVKSLYDMYDTKDVYNQADVVGGTVSFGDLGRYKQIQQAMVYSRPNIQVKLLDSRNQAIWTQIVDTPALSHTGIYAGVPVFVDIGNRSNYTRFNLKWPVAPFQMTIDGHSPIFTAAQIVVPTQISAQVREIRVDIVRQN
jgi:hypothetical protein